jgi:uncharacterized protein YkwD
MEPQVFVQPGFVTATLAPIKARFTLIALPPSPEAASTTPPAPIFTITPLSVCKDAAVLLRDVTIPDYALVKAGEKFTKTWEFQNTGTCPWVDYTIRFSTGDKINAPLSAPIADTFPNGKVQVSVDLTAPTVDVTYTGHFTLLNSNGEAILIGAEKTFWVKFVVGAAMLPTASVANPAQLGICIHSQNEDYVNEIISLINAEREKVGSQVLTVNPRIAAIAQSHSEDMAFNNFLSHNGSDLLFGQRIALNLLNWEIIAIGTPQNAMDQWRRDEHWNILINAGPQIGVGYAYNSCSDYGGYFTVDFG